MALMNMHAPVVQNLITHISVSAMTGVRSFLTKWMELLGLSISCLPSRVFFLGTFGFINIFMVLLS